jgi:putative N6-adenine-specific DNA methylase
MKVLTDFENLSELISKRMRLPIWGSLILFYLCSMSKPVTIIVKTFAGLEPLLAKELEALGAQQITPGKRVVQFEGNKQLLYRANLRLRTALRILWPIKAFQAKDENQLYAEIRKINWEDYMKVDDTLAVDCVAHSKIFNHSKYAALKTKDAVVDQFRKIHHKRPNVDVNNPTIRIHVHIREDQVEVSLDSSGDSLHKRGYRLKRTEAPINEVLAAGMIMLTGWDGDSHFIDPMCGSGTIVIEAASIALNRAPQLNRRYFGFMSWRDFDDDLWEEEVSLAKGLEREFTHRIMGSDKSPISLMAARDNLSRSGFEEWISLRQKSFQTLPPPPKEGGILVTNPPYGERLKPEDINELYSMIGDTLKQQYAGYDAWIFSSNREAVKHVGLRASKKLVLFNGPLECRFLQYQMYTGTRE